MEICTGTDAATYNVSSTLRKTLTVGRREHDLVVVIRVFLCQAPREVLEHSPELPFLVQIRVSLLLKRILTDAFIQE